MAEAEPGDLSPLDPQEIESIKKAEVGYGYGASLPLLQRAMVNIDAEVRARKAAEETIAALRAELASRQGGNATAWSELRESRAALQGKIDALDQFCTDRLAESRKGISVPSAVWSGLLVIIRSQPSSEEADDA
jgi:hypothetical protein